MNNPAFESQQFADQVQARRESHIRDQGSIVAQGLTGSVQGFMQGQQQAMQMQQAQQRMQLESMQVTGELALNEARRQSALEELQWARELHTTDMLALQKKAMEAQTQLTIAQANKAKDALGITEAPITVSEEERDAALANGMDITFSNGRAIVVQASPERMKEGRARRDAREMAAALGRSLATLRDQYNPNSPAVMGLIDVQSALLAGELNTAQARQRIAAIAAQEDSGMGQQTGSLSLDAPAPQRGAAPPAASNNDAMVGTTIDQAMSGIVIPSTRHGLAGTQRTPWSSVPPERQAAVRAMLAPMVRTLLATENGEAKARKFVAMAGLSDEVIEAVYGVGPYGAKR